MEARNVYMEIFCLKFEQPISSRLHNGVGSIEIDESPSGLRRRYFRNFPKEAGTTASLISIIPRSIYNPGVMAGLIIPNTASESNVSILPSIESLPIATLSPPPWSLDSRFLCCWRLSSVSSARSLHERSIRDRTMT